MPRVLIVATDGFEEWELFGPRQILQERGAEVVLASLKRDPIQATVHDDPGKTIRPDLTVDEANADDFDALILPGGVRNPDQLRTARQRHRADPRLCRAGQADRRDLPRAVAAGRGGPGARPDGDRAGRRSAPTSAMPAAKVVDEAAVTDGNIVTSRNPDDVEAFTNALIDLDRGRPEVERNSPAERTPGLTDWQGFALIRPSCGTRRHDGSNSRIERGRGRAVRRRGRLCRLHVAAG